MSPSEPKPTIVLLHGLARSWRSMAKLRKHLESLGYPTWARTYPSRRMPLSELAATVAAWIEGEVGPGPIIGVTHSLGGILARHMAAALPWRGLVMLAPPNTGSTVARSLSGYGLFQWFYGPAGREVVADERWPSPPGPFAVVAGTRSLAVDSPITWATQMLRLFPAGEPNDGVLMVQETRHSEMVDFQTVDVSHTWIMNHPRTWALIESFLAHGDFSGGMDVAPG